MIRGLLRGAGSALGLSVLLVSAVSLFAPSPQTTPTSDAPKSGEAPEAPVLRSQSDPVPSRPAPLPQRSAEIAQQAEDGDSDAVISAVDLPEGSEFNRPPQDFEPVAPVADDQPRLAGSVSTPRGPAAPTSAPAPDTSTLEQPLAVQSVGGVSAPEAGDAPALPALVAEGAPQTFQDVAQDDTPVDVSDAADPAQVEEVAGVQTEAAEPQEEAAPEAEEPTVALVETPVQPLPDIAEETADGGAETAEAEAQEDAAEPVLPRRIVLDSERDATEDAVEETETAALTEDGTAEDTADQDLPAIVANAVPFENPANLPLFGVVLIDDPNGGVPRENLLAFDFPVTFAVDPTAPGAKEAVQTYRNAGHEVMILADALALQGGAQDVEVALTGAMAEMPGAVAVLDRRSGGFAGNRQALAALLPPLIDIGLGFVAYPGGLNSGVATAQRDGVPAATAYRSLDDGGERATVITRYLDRATFEAAQDGQAIVVGRTSADTITALYSWALGRRSETVAVAPISHILMNAAQ